jgi:hypothetical protein
MEQHNIEQETAVEAAEHVCVKLISLKIPPY